MRIIWLADIHLNFLDALGVEYFLKTVSSKNADAILIAGDIGEADTLQGYLDAFLRAVAVPVYFVLGNHDYYRGSIELVRGQLIRFLDRRPQLVWLTNSSVVSLTTSTALIGHDSWADGRLGEYWKSNVQLNDFTMIGEFIGRTKEQRLDFMASLAEEAARHFERVLPEALKTHQRVIILTHVPPFAGATWHQGRMSDPDWLPFFSSKVVGEILETIMSSHPEREALVLCGHTHSSGTHRAAENIQVITGSARYGYPQVQGDLEVE